MSSGIVKLNIEKILEDDKLWGQDQAFKRMRNLASITFSYFISQELHANFEV